MGDYIDNDLDWSEDLEDDRTDEVTCKRCGVGGLTWYPISTEVKPKYRLFGTVNGRLLPHVCREVDHTDAFEDES